MKIYKVNNTKTVTQESYVIFNKISAIYIAQILLRKYSSSSEENSSSYSSNFKCNMKYLTWKHNFFLFHARMP